MGKWDNFVACKKEMTRKLGSAKAAERYCGSVYHKVHNKELVLRMRRIQTRLFLRKV